MPEPLIPPAGGPAGGPGSGEPAVDHLGQRVLTGTETWWWYLVAGVSYVIAGVYQKWLLNWIIGPVWLVAVVWVGPPLWDRLRGRRDTRGAGGARRAPGAGGATGGDPSP